MKMFTLVLITYNSEKLESLKYPVIWIWLSKLCLINPMGYHVAIKNYFFKIDYLQDVILSENLESMCYL